MEVKEVEETFPLYRGEKMKHSLYLLPLWMYYYKPTTNNILATKLNHYSNYSLYATIITSYFLHNNRYTRVHPFWQVLVHRLDHIAIQSNTYYGFSLISKFLPKEQYYLFHLYNKLFFIASIIFFLTCPKKEINGKYSLFFKSIQGVVNCIYIYKTCNKHFTNRESILYNTICLSYLVANLIYSIKPKWSIIKKDYFETHDTFHIFTLLSFYTTVVINSSLANRLK